MGRLSKAALEKIPKNVDFPAKRAGVKSWKDEDRQGAPAVSRVMMMLIVSNWANAKVLLF